MRGNIISNFLREKKPTTPKFHLHSQHSVFCAVAEFGKVLAKACHLFVDLRPNSMDLFLHEFYLA